MKSLLSVRAATRASLRLALPLAIGCLSIMTSRPALAEEAMMRMLTVTGVGTESVATTLTQVQLGVEIQAETAEAVQREVARRSSAVVELLRSRNVSKLQTTGIYLSPVYDYSDNQQRLIGYRGSNTVSFRIATDQAGTLLDDAVTAGATQINGISFVASDETLETAQRQALREATQHAQAQAEVVLSALGLRSQEIVGIQINSSSPVMPPYPPPYARLDQAAASSTPVVGGEQEVQATVTLQIRY